MSINNKYLVWVINSVCNWDCYGTGEIGGAAVTGLTGSAAATVATGGAATEDGIGAGQSLSLLCLSSWALISAIRSFEGGSQRGLCVQ